MDTGTGLALLGSAEVIKKILGPTAEYIGEGLKDFTEKRGNNLKNIFKNAEKKLGHRIELEGAVPPRVLRGILDEGSFCDDFIATEYFGGVLASSKSGISRDDRGVSLIALISRLSAYQLRTHYVFYHMAKHLFNGTYINVGASEDRNKMQTYTPLDVYMDAMEFAEQENFRTLISHIMFGLHKENLIGEDFVFGPTKEAMQKYFEKATRPGITFYPTALGVELFLWAYGKSDLPIKEFFNPMNQFEIDGRINIGSGYCKTKESV